MKLTEAVTLDANSITISRESTVLYLSNYDDAAEVAGLLIKNGYCVQVGPADIFTKGVRVSLFENGKDKEKEGG